MTENKDNELKVVNVRLVREPSLYAEKPIRTSDDAVKLLADELSQYDREVFCVLNLKTNGQVINMNIASMGILNASLVSMREIFKSSVLSNAAAVICAHNHPSGSCQPSKEDELVTQRLQLCGELLDIKLVDHIIVAGESGRTCSLRALGLIDDRSVLSELMNAKGQSVAREPDKRRLDDRINSITVMNSHNSREGVSKEAERG